VAVLDDHMMMVSYAEMECLRCLVEVLSLSS